MTELQQLKQICDVEKTGIKTFKSYDLDVFENHPLNRNENPYKVEALIESFKKGYLEIPCIGKIGKNKIILYDGGHRRKALILHNERYKGSTKHPQLPIVFNINDNITIELMRLINDCNSNWKMKDFFESMLKEGKEQYKIAQKFMNTYPKIPLAVALAALENKPMSQIMSDRIKNGELEIFSYKLAVRNANRLMDFLNLDFTKFCNNKSTMYALLKLFKISGYDHEMYINKLKRNAKLLSQIGYFSTVKQYGEPFHTTYNHGNRNILNIRGVFLKEVKDWEEEYETDEEQKIIV